MPCHCFNGVQDMNESGVDCGGPCLECVEVTEIYNQTIGNKTSVIIISWNVTPLCLNQRIDGSPEGRAILGNNFEGDTR